MNGVPVSTREQLERELEYYRSEYNALGARMLRVQEESSHNSREARRSKLVARLVREAHAIGSWDLSEEEVGEPILSIVADSSLCDQALFLVRGAESQCMFKVEHSLGTSVAAELLVFDPPDFLFVSSIHDGGPFGQALRQFTGLPYLLWAYNGDSGRALLLGKRFEGNIHRPFEVGDREIVAVALAVYEDVLLRRRAEAILRKAKQVAEEANEARSRFLANLSHELRTPVNAIIGFAKLLTKEGVGNQPSPESEEYARMILDAGQRLGSLARDILDFSAFSHGTPQLRIDWVPAEYLLNTAARSYLVQAKVAGIEIIVSKAATGLEVAIDYDRFRQVLSNLIGNALKFTPLGGRVTISADHVGMDSVMFTVQDDGIGMNVEDIPRALEPFVQLDDRSVQGAGLGLPIALQLVEAHGGNLRIESVRVKIIPINRHLRAQRVGWSVYQDSRCFGAIDSA
jgi:signal transduction histidine kinase